MNRFWGKKNKTDNQKVFFTGTCTKIQELCRAQPHLVFPHPDECQLYYNCSVTYVTVPTHLEQHLVECPYPSLFSTQSLQCENFTEVCCGFRKEIKDKCKASIFFVSMNNTKHSPFISFLIWQNRKQTR